MSADASLFITTDAVGGVWSYSLALARGVAEAGARCVLAVLGPAASAAQRDAVAAIAGCTLLETGLPLDWTVTNRGALDGIAHSLVAQARAAGCGAAHLHAPALAVQRWPVPVVAVAHSCMATWWEAVHGGTPPDDTLWHRTATAEGLARAGEVVAPSQAFSQALQRAYGPARPIRVVHNGLPEISCENQARTKTVLTAGRLWDPGKNLGVLDDAACMLDVPVIAAGRADAPDGSRAAFTHVRTLGNLTQDALRTAMGRAAVFASPSLYEPFGLAVLEAAQQGTPLLLSDTPTFRELWSDAAVFADPRRPAAWAAEIASLMDDPARRAELGQAAQRRSRRYTQHAMVSATLGLHRGLARRALHAA